MRRFFLLSALVLVSHFVNSQNCNGTSQFILLGAKNSGVFHQLGMVNTSPHSSDPSQTEIIAEAWTCNAIGIPLCNFRATIKYKLSQIPSYATILSANLYLYARTNSTNAYVGHPTYSNGGGNAVSIKRVTNDWDTTGTTYGWNDQTTTPQDSVVLPSSTNDAQDYVADLKNLVQFWVNHPDSNFGMQLKQIDETYYKSMIFHSGTSPAAQQPRLEICYITEDNYPKVYGTTYYDANVNGVKDTGEVVAPFVKVALSNGDFTFSDVNGYYEINTKTFGTYDVNVTAPNFYNATNLVNTFSFNNWGVSYQNNVGFYATSNTDSIDVHIIPFHRWARLGWSFPCYIQYENLGNTLLQPTMDVYYDSSILHYDSCSNPLISNTSNLLFGGTVTSLKPGERQYYLAYLDTKITAPIGDTTKLHAILNAGNAWVFDTVTAYVSAAYDPNEIEATESLTTKQVAEGKYIDYTIHFQNVGNDTAFNIVIKDTLGSLLKPASLQMISSSYPCKLTVSSNMVTVKFNNIKLVHKSANELKSMGFVKFRVKPITTVVNGNVINNKASIYFDYNAPIVTNTATTLIKNPTVLPVKIKSYELKVTREKYIENIWKTDNETNLSYFNIQRSINGKDYETIGKVIANNSMSNEYHFTDKQPATYYGLTTLYYRIQSVDKDAKTSHTNSIKVTLNSNSQSVNIYPNPAKDIVNIECAGAKQLFITDYLGRTIMQLKVNSEKLVVDTKEFAKGIYVIKIILNNGEIKTAKLIKE